MEVGKAKGQLFLWTIKIRQRNKVEWECHTKAEGKDHCFVSINLSTHMQVLQCNTCETLTELWFLPVLYGGLISLVFCLPLFFFPAKSIDPSVVLLLFCFSWLSLAPPTDSLTPRSALFPLWVSFILPQSLLAGLLSISESGGNQVDEENTQLFGSRKEQWDANFQRARGHFNPKCWKS